MRVERDRPGLGADAAVTPQAVGAGLAQRRDELVPGRARRVAPATAGRAAQAVGARHDARHGEILEGGMGWDGTKARPASAPATRTACGETAGLGTQSPLEQWS